MSISSITAAVTPMSPAITPQGSRLPASGSGQSPVAVAAPVPNPALAKSAAVGATGSAAHERTQVEQAVAKVKQQIQQISDNRMDFSIDSASGKTVVRITERTTGELIRQIPSEEMLDIARSLDKLQGVLVKQKA